MIIGGGTIGLSLLLALRDRDAGEVTLVEPDAGKRRAALALGASRAITPAETVALARSFTAVFDCVGSQQTLDTCSTKRSPLPKAG